MSLQRLHVRAALALCVVALAGPGTSGAATRNESRTYVANSVVSVAPNCALSGNVPIGENPDSGVGGVCFPVLEGERSAAYQIHDAVSPLPVGGEAFFLDDAGNFREPLVLFCDHGTIAIPEGVASLVVQPDYVGAVPCFPGPSVGGTTGTITAQFS